MDLEKWYSEQKLQRLSDDELLKTIKKRYHIYNNDGKKLLNIYIIFVFHF